MKETERIVDVYESTIEQVGDLLFFLTHPLELLDHPEILERITDKKQHKKNTERLKRIRKRYLKKDYGYLKRENL